MTAGGWLYTHFRAFDRVHTTIREGLSYVPIIPLFPAHKQFLNVAPVNAMHCLTRIRFALILRKIHFTLGDEFHFCGICIVM